LSRPVRIFIGLTEFAGYFAGLREGFEELGFEVVRFDDSSDEYAYGRAPRGASVGGLARRLRSAQTRIAVNDRWIAPPLRAGFRAARAPLRLIMLSEALIKCDIFIFGGNSFVAGRDLRLIRSAGKKIVWVFTGTDHRPPYLNGKAVRQWQHDPKRLVSEASAVRTYVQRVESHAHGIIAHGPSAQFHRKPFAEFLSVGIPVRPNPDNASVPAGKPWPGPPGVRILHCPTDPAKGSELIRSIVARLQARGLPISYLEMVGRPNAEIRSRLNQADIVVDEVFSDSPMGVLGAEAAIPGVPTIVGGYWASQIKNELPAHVIPPSVFVLPSEIEPWIERMVISKDERLRIGREASLYVNREWRPACVAERVLALAYGQVGDLTMTEPAGLTYCAGWGMSMDQLSTTISRLVRSWGPASLSMSHNPALEAMMVSMAHETPTHLA
jgi:hypothetical protein